MLNVAKKPALIVGTAAVLVLSAAGISAAASSGRLAGTTPQTQRGHGHGPAQDPSALAKALGVSVTELETAVQAARAKETTSDPVTEAAEQAKALAAALGTTEATIQTVLDAQRPAKGDRPTGTTPPAGNAPKGARGGHGGGSRSLADQSALITALAKATGKSEATVKAALSDADEARASARKAREAEFAKNLAVQLGLSESKVVAAIEASRPARPTRASQQATTQTK